MSAKAEKAKFYKAKLGKIILSLLVVFSGTYCLGVLLIPFKDVQRTSLQARLTMPKSVKNFPITMACNVPRYTEVIPDCGAGACPLIYKIKYETRAQQSKLKAQIDTYVNNLNKPHGYILLPDENTFQENTCSKILIEFYSLNY